MEKKIATTPDEICKNLPGNLALTIDEFMSYFQYCRGLQFEEKPDYNYIRSLFKLVFEKYNYENDFDFDWNQIKKLKEKDEEKDKTTNDGNNFVIL